MCKKCVLISMVNIGDVDYIVFRVLILCQCNEVKRCVFVIQILVAQKQSSFAGYSQHDAEEFMEFLLDGLHEVSPPPNTPHITP